METIETLTIFQCLGNCDIGINFFIYRVNSYFSKYIVVEWEGS